MISSQLDSFDLQRYPRSKDSSLRAWNAADEYIIQHIAETCGQDHPPKSLKTLVINDQFGAITVALQNFSPFFLSDSFLALQATTKNLQANHPNFDIQQFTDNQCLSVNLNAEKKSATLQSSNNTKAPSQFDLVVIRVPKHNSLLALQLLAVKPLLKPDTIIVAGGMTKEIHTSTLQIFESIIGTTKTSLAQKKARLIFSENTQTKTSSLDIKSFKLPDKQMTIVGLPGVFSREKLDMGAQVLLNYLPDTKPNAMVADLGCGNGVLGAVIAKNTPSSRVTLCDESALAIKSAQLTFTENNLSNGTFYHTDVFKGVPQKSFDLILCNPPFHQQNTQTLSIANQMFLQSAQKLATDGKLLVVANRHLKYGPGLKRYFKQVSPISSDNRFIVWLAKLPKSTAQK